MLHVDMYATCSLIYLACDTLYNQCRSMPYGFFFLFFFFSLNSGTLLMYATLDTLITKS